jgi:hypothetical protein
MESQTPEPDAVITLQAYAKRLEEERRLEHDPLKRKSLGLRLFEVKAALLRAWKQRRHG